jgi:hypothetical protein
VCLKAKRKPREKKVDPAKPLLMPTPWEGLPGDLDGIEGFVYLIRHKRTGKAYIGRKYLKSNTRVKVAGKKRKTRKVSESDWRHYKSSCAELKQAIQQEGLDQFEFKALHLCKTRRETNFREVEEQFKRNVLSAKLPDGDWAYYNANILSRYFRGIIE